MLLCFHSTEEHKNYNSIIGEANPCGSAGRFRFKLFCEPVIGPGCSCRFRHGLEREDNCSYLLCINAVGPPSQTQLRLPQCPTKCYSPNVVEPMRPSLKIRISFLRWRRSLFPWNHAQHYRTTLCNWREAIPVASPLKQRQTTTPFSRRPRSFMSTSNLSKQKRQLRLRLTTGLLQSLAGSTERMT